jgi:hypothetical protein
MSPEAQRIAIAEACGWRYSPTAAPEVKLAAIMRWIAPGQPDWCETQLPDFLNDLNAMHEAEDVLTEAQKDAYVTTLCLEVQPEPELYHATAAQRAEAFLRTLNLWEGGK